MSFGFHNAWMLAGLGALLLPVLVHLFRARPAEIQPWGAIRFLKIGEQARRRFQLQDRLLLFLRMAIIACVALALARPWGQGAWAPSWGTPAPRDVVFILDGSASMDRQGERPSPARLAVQTVHAALESMRPDDAVMLIDARQVPRRLLSKPMTSGREIRTALESWSPSAGASHLPAAIIDAMKVLATGMRPTQEIIVLTDGQSTAWRFDDPLSWDVLKELHTLARTPPEIHVITLEQTGAKANRSVGPLRLSSEIVRPGAAISIQAPVRMDEDDLSQIHASLAVNQRLQMNAAQQIRPSSSAEPTWVTFQQEFAEPGAHLVEVSLTPDDLVADNTSAAVVIVTKPLSALVVNGGGEAPTESFFIHAAFASVPEATWVQPRVIAPHELSAERLADHDLLILCNVEALSRDQWDVVRNWVSLGGGLILAPGDRTNPANWNEAAGAESNVFLPVKLIGIESDSTAAGQSGVTVDSSSLQRSWLRPFQSDRGVDFCDARFSNWWRLELNAENVDASGEVLARLTNGLPFIAARPFGAGRVVVLAVPLDADWSTLPAKNDFVPFLHEMAFAVAQTEPARNVLLGTPLALPLRTGESVHDFLVEAPGGQTLPPERSTRNGGSVALFRETTIPGVYWFRHVADPDRAEPFVVLRDESESDLSPLTDSQWKALIARGGIRRPESLKSALAPPASAGSRVEFWRAFLILALLLMLCEAALTRFITQGERSTRPAST